MSQGKCCCFANGGNPAASRNRVVPPLAWAALAAVLLGGPAAARAAVTLTDPPSTPWTYSNTSGSQALSQSFTVSPGADVLVVEIGMYDSSKTDTLAFSFGSQSFTATPVQQVSGNGGNYLYSDIYYLYNPNPGTNSISFTLPSTAAECAYNAFTLSGANTGIAPISGGNDVGNGATTNSVTLSGTSALSAGSFAAVDYSIRTYRSTYPGNPSYHTNLSATSGAAKLVRL